MNSPARWHHFVAGAAVLSALVWSLDQMREGQMKPASPPLRVFTDGATGCQYLTAGRSGSLVARTDGQGTHLGCEAARRLAGPGS